MKKEGVSGLSSRKDLAEKRLLELMSDLEKKRMKIKEKENEKIIKKYMGGSLRKGKK